MPIAAEAVLAFQTIPRRHIDARTPTVVSVGMIDGGSRFNIIADKVTLTGTVRTLSEDGPKTVKGKMDAILEGITSSYGASCTLDYVETTPVVFNNPALVAASVPRAALGGRRSAGRSAAADGGRGLRGRSWSVLARWQLSWPIICTGVNLEPGTRNLAPGGVLITT